jgi:glycosyltransferase involved in cell wall biosynthesis
MVLTDTAVDDSYGERIELGLSFPEISSEESDGSTSGSTTSIARIPAFLSPYWSPQRFKEAVAQFSERSTLSLQSEESAEPFQHALVDGEVYGVDLDSALSSQIALSPKIIATEDTGSAKESLYPLGDSIFEEVERFTSHVVANFSGHEFDIIHAHDWMTFPAAVALSQLTGKPLVVHVHSLEQDRSGLFVDRNIEKLEKLGLETSSRVIAVSHYTRRAIERFHEVPSRKIRVVHNGVYPRQAVQDYRIKKTWPRNVVLFAGRVTFQKGPDYFVEVAARVIPRVPGVLFVLAGTGDMLPTVRERVGELGLTEYFLFPGFLSGEELEEMFSVADVYVMPSVSEPFGITALEAISFDTPVIISKQSGVSEVLEHALKVDFWDLDRMAGMIANVLLNRDFRDELIQMAKSEVKNLHWDAAATKTIEVYQELLAGESLPAAPSPRS